ncbi:MAG: VOC family protein [Nitrospirota bacterium]
MIRYKGLNHLALATGDMDRTIRFWRDLLGMRLIAGLGKPGYRQYFFEISGRELISFFEWPEVEPLPEKDAGRVAKGPFAFDHVCLEVEDKDALWTLKEKLEAADIWVSEVIDNGFIHSIFTFDPNGIALEFCYSVEGVDIRKEPRMLDTAPSEVTQEGPEPQPDKWPPVEMPTPIKDRKIYPGELRKLIKPEFQKVDVDKKAD